MTDNHESLADYFSRGGKIKRITKVTYAVDGSRTTEMELRGPSLPDLKVTAALDEDLAVTSYSATTVELEPETGEAPHASLFVWMQAALIAAIRAESFEASYRLLEAKGEYEAEDHHSCACIHCRHRRSAAQVASLKAERDSGQRAIMKLVDVFERQDNELTTLRRAAKAAAEFPKTLAATAKRLGVAQGELRESMDACRELRDEALQYREELGIAADTLTEAQTRILNLERELADSADQRQRLATRNALARESYIGASARVLVLERELASSADRRQRRDEQVRLARELLERSPDPAGARGGGS